MQVAIEHQPHGAEPLRGAEPVGQRLAGRRPPAIVLFAQRPVNPVAQRLRVADRGEKLRLLTDFSIALIDAEFLILRDLW
jgi:hypothetical protein